MAAKRKQGAFLIALMLGAGLVWVVQNLPEKKLGEGGEFEAFENCTLVPDRGNDGDSFHIRMSDGKVRHLRLYFVDAPESAVKRYDDGNTNIKRLRHQGEYFAGLSQKATVGVGQDAKIWVKKLLTEVESFTVFTRGKEVYDSGRIYALLSVQSGGGRRWLHELLVEEGLARIYTMGTDLPDGTTNADQLRRLHGLQKSAKGAKKGAWELASTPNRS